jgi:hypothetical protein
MRRLLIIFSAILLAQSALAVGLAQQRDKLEGRPTAVPSKAFAATSLSSSRISSSKATM